MERNTIVIIVVIAVLGLGIICCGVGGYLTYRAAKQVENEAQDAKDRKDKADKIIDDTMNRIEEEMNNYENDVNSYYAPDFFNMPGDAICNAVLCSDVWINVSVLAELEDSSCSSYRLADTRVMDEYVAGVGWSEEWDVSVCDKSITVEIKYSESPYGGTDFLVSKK